MDSKDLTFEEIENVVSQNSCLEDLEDPRDFQFTEIMAAGDVAIPENFSIREQMTPVKSQGSRGTCVGFSCTGITEFHNAKEWKNSTLDLSEEYMFRRIKEIDIKDYNYSGYGAYLRSGAKALQEFGTCLEASAPYNSGGGEEAWKTFSPTPKMDAEAKTYRMKSYLSVPARNIDELKKALFLSKTPLLIGVTLYESYRQAKTNGGKVPVPKTGEKVIGGHALELVGFTKTHLELKNSWGSSWGDSGYLWWPIEAINKLHGLAWSFVDLLTNPHVVEDQLIEMNKSGLLDHQKSAWEKAIAKGGIINGGTRPQDQLTKGDFMVFLDRLGLLEK